MNEIKFTNKRTIGIRRVSIPEIPKDELTGGRWYRAAVKAIAEDMVACGAVRVNDWWDAESDMYNVYYMMQSWKPERELP